jgi:hypothetical protein
MRLGCRESSDEELAMTARKGQRFDRKPSGGEPEQECGSSGPSTVVVYGDPQLVADAFALALKAMDTSANLLTVGAAVAKRKTLDG